MTHKPEAGLTPATLGEIEQTDQKIASLAERLDQFGKSPADVIALFERLESEGFEGFDFSKAQWSIDQIRTSIELMCLCMFRTVQSGDLRPDPVALATVALWYGSVIQQRAHRIFDGMLPDYERGRKAHEGSAKSRSTPEARALRRQRVQNINPKVLLDWIKLKGPGSLDALTKIRQCELIAKELQKRYGERISPKTVGRILWPKSGS